MPFLPPYVEPVYVAPSYRPAIDLGLLLLLGRDPAATVPAVHADFWAALVAWVAVHVPDLTGQLWGYRAPDESDGIEVDLPFGVYEDGAGLGAGFTTESPTLQDGSASVSIYAAHKDEADALALAFAAAVRDAPLRFEEGRLMYLRVARRSGAGVEPEPGPGGVDVFRALLTMDYVYTVTT